MLPFDALLNAIQALMLEHRAMFEGMGMDMVAGFLGWHIFFAGVDWWRERVNMGDLLMLMLKLSLGVTMCVHYSNPDPLFGWSFSDFFLESGKAMGTQVNDATVSEVMKNLNKFRNKVNGPTSWWDVEAAVNYAIYIVIVNIANIAVFALLSWGKIATAIVITMGPVFVSFYLCPIQQFERWFFGFVSCLFEYAVLWPVAINLFLYIFVRVLIQTEQMTGPNMSQIDATTYSMGIVMIVGSFIFGLTRICHLPRELLSGHSGGSGWGVGPYRIG